MKISIFIITFFMYFISISAEDKNMNVNTFISKVINHIVQFSLNANLDNPDIMDIVDNQTGKIKTNKIPGFVVKIALTSENETSNNKKLTFEKMCLLSANALTYIEKKKYGADFYKNHLYYSKLDKYANKIKDIEKVSKPFQDAVIELYARGILELNNEGKIYHMEKVSNEYAESILSIIFLNKYERQNREIKRYLEIFPGVYNQYTFNLEKDSFLVKLETEGSEFPVHSVLTINKKGEVSYKRDAYNYGGNFHEPLFYSGKISPSQVNELFNFILNKNTFFILPSDMSTEMELMDSSTETITIEYNGKEHKIGGYHPFGNNYYNAISEKIRKYTESITKEK